jgi:hypothetical protein
MKSELGQTETSTRGSGMSVSPPEADFNCLQAQVMVAHAPTTFRITNQQLCVLEPKSCHALTNLFNEP